MDNLFDPNSLSAGLKYAEQDDTSVYIDESKFKDYDPTNNLDYINKWIEDENDNDEYVEPQFDNGEGDVSNVALPIGNSEDGQGNSGGGDVVTNNASVGFKPNLMGYASNNTSLPWMNNNSHGFSGNNMNMPGLNFPNYSQFGNPFGGNSLLNTSFNNSQSGDQQVDKTLQDSKELVPPVEMSKWNKKDDAGNPEGKQWTKSEAEELGGAISSGMNEAGSTIAGMYGNSNFSFS